MKEIQDWNDFVIVLCEDDRFVCWAIHMRIIQARKVLEDDFCTDYTS
jgi:hypothetical protein